MVLIIEKISPKKVELAMSGVPFCNINNNTPERPIANPAPLRNEILSLSIKAAKTNANIGLVERMIEEFTGVVISSPIRKRVWFITTPKNEHPKRNNKSFLVTGSFGINRLVIQNKAAVEILLIDTRANGLI
jgi:hypothetical protein